MLPLHQHLRQLGILCTDVHKVATNLSGLSGKFQAEDRPGAALPSGDQRMGTAGWCLGQVGGESGVALAKSLSTSEPHFLFCEAKKIESPGINCFQDFKL